MILSSTKPVPRAAGPCPTLWGLDPLQLHDRFWAARGVQVVRHGEPVELIPEARLFLLLEPQALLILESGGVDRALQAQGKHLVYVRLHEAAPAGRHERVITDDQGRFVRFERVYDRPHGRMARAAFTPTRSVAEAWQETAHSADGWRALRRTVQRSRRFAIACGGMLFDGFDPQELAAFVKALTGAWWRPNLTVGRARELAPGIWGDSTSTIDTASKLVGPVWIGAGRGTDAGATVIGPAVLWDDPALRPEPGPMQWQKGDLDRAWHPDEPRHSAIPSRRATSKRAFDIVFSLFALAFTLPLYLPIALAILLEDGWPIFFLHRRETFGGREFPCIKFRSMKKEAEKLKPALTQKNKADGPQFFMEDDPRLTRVGRFIRRYRLDELPQFINVLIGQMSVVGPRPSPFRENQFCPAWREARLSVRPGITGLWQVQRTRAHGSDFQEWIKYDIEYVESAHWWLDLVIIWKTFLSMVRGGDAES